jgi:glycosyltransferase A (GT-A) superfamily protein (DUF2064 family)
VSAALAVIAKAPEPGRVKTRLCPPLTPAQAAEVAEASLRDVIAAMFATPAARHVIVLDGDPPTWLPPALDVVPQRGDGLDERLTAAFADIGPTHDAVLGPAADGGYWAIGLRRAHPRAVRGVPMSSRRTLAAQRARLAALGLRRAELRALRDIDTFRDAVAVAVACPRSRFARSLLGVGGRAAV